MRKLLSSVLVFSSLTFAQLAQINIPITAVNGVNTQLLHLGLDQGATTGIDTLLLETALTPPVQGTYDVRFDLTSYGYPNTSTRVDCRNAASYPFTGVCEHTLMWQFGSEDTSLVLNYLLPSFSQMNIKDPYGGSLFNSGTLYGYGSYNIPAPYVGKAIVTMTYTNAFPEGFYPYFTFFPETLNMGSVIVGDTVTLPVTINNVGIAPLFISSVTSTDAQFTLTHAPLPITIHSGANSEITVTFIPATAGLKTCSFIFTYNGLSPQSYTLTGKGLPVTFPLSVDILNGWNMVSVPGTHPTNMNVDTWWSGRNPMANVYKWAPGFMTVTAAAPTEGYWMLHTGANTYNTGDEWPPIITVSHDPIPISGGWNVLGAFEDTLLTAGLTTTPPGLIVYPIYGYNGSYYPATHLLPGQAYWVYSSGNGVINMPADKKQLTLIK